jgi:hypothetical protein
MGSVKASGFDLILVSCSRQEDLEFAYLAISAATTLQIRWWAVILASLVALQ